MKVKRIRFYMFAVLTVLLLPACASETVSLPEADLTGSFTPESETSEQPMPEKGDDSMYSLKQSDFIPAPDVWKTPYVRPEKGFEFEVEISSLGTSYDTGTVQSSIENLELGSWQALRNQSSVCEWGYSFTHLDGQTDGAGKAIEAGYKTPPETRAEALQVIKQFLLSQYLNNGENPRPWISVNGHYMWHHYAGEFGFDILGSEIGENINSYQMHIAFNRGAAKQYGVPWAIDFSAWHGPGITDYSSGKIWGDYSGPDNGHSMSLLRRTYFMSYMAGAPYIVAEAGGAISFYDTTDDNGNYELSPYGHVGKEFFDFTRDNPDIGITYIPFGIVLDYYHDVYPGFEEKLAFNYFPYNKGDTMTWKLLDLFFPGGWETMGRQEEGTLVNGPYGDTCDVLLQNASQEVLNSYPVLILSGDITFSSEEILRYTSYVTQGGTLVLNSAYLNFFPEYKQDFSGQQRYEISDGKGKVIIYGNDYSVNELDGIIREQLEIRMPLKVSENIEHIVTVKDGSLYIALLNSDGVRKDFHTPPKVDKTKVKTVEITYTGELKIKRVYNLITKTNIDCSDNRVKIIIEPGELTVFEFIFD